MLRVIGWLSALLASLIVVIAVLLAGSGSADVSFEIAKGLINLAVAVAVTGILTFVLNQRSQERARREEQHEILTEALQELKGGYEEAYQVRFHLATSPTARTLIEQMPGLGRARARLQRVQRERFILDTPVDRATQDMLDYLTDVADEYSANYSDLVRESLLEDRARQRVRSGETEQISLVPLDPARFGKLYAFMDRDNWAVSPFHKSYRIAKDHLRRRLGELNG